MLIWYVSKSYAIQEMLGSLHASQNNLSKSGLIRHQAVTVNKVEIPILPHYFDATTRWHNMHTGNVL